MASTEIVTRDPNSTVDDFEHNTLCGYSFKYYHNRKTLRYAKKHKISDDEAFEILYGNNHNKSYKKTKLSCINK